MSKSTNSTIPFNDEALDQLRQRVRELEEALEQQQETEQLLKQRVAMLNEHVHLLDVIHDALLVRDLQGKILLWNRTAEQLYGWSRDEATGSQAHTLLQTQFPADLATIHEQLRATNEWQGELTQTSRSGETLIVISHWKLYRQAWNQSEVVVEVNRDITEARRTEQELRASEAELRALFAAISDVILVLDHEGYYRKIAAKSARSSASEARSSCSVRRASVMSRLTSTTTSL
jgi:PAS domain S-box-containing protein